MILTQQENLIRDLRKFKLGEQESFFNVENDISKGYVIVKYQKLILEEKFLYNDNIKIILPKEFSLMEDNLVISKYSAVDGPDYVYTNEDTTVNFNFTLEKGEISNEDIEEIRNIILKEFKRMYPASEMQNIEVLETDKKQIGTFSFDIPVLDGSLFNRIYFIPLQIGLLILTFSCDVFQKKEWTKFINDIVLTIKESIEEDRTE